MYVFDLLRNCSQETRKKQDMDMKKWTIDIISGQVPQTHGGTQKNKLPFRCTLLRTRELPFHTLVSVCHNYRDSGDLGETLREGNGTPLQYSCLENPMDGGAWWAAVHEVAESWTWLRDFTFTLHFHALEKEMATHSSVLTWRIPGTEEPGGLPSMGSRRVGHDWGDSAAAAAKSHYVTYGVLNNSKQ